MDMWEFEQAADQLEMLLDQAQHAGPQGIRRDGQLVAVVVPPKNYVRPRQADALIESIRDLAVMGLTWEPVRARSIHFERGRIYIELSDGREIGAPLDWFPELAGAGPQHGQEWQIDPGGVSVHWPELPAGLDVLELLRVQALGPRARAEDR